MVIHCIDNRHRSKKRHHLSRAFSFFLTICFHFYRDFFNLFAISSPPSRADLKTKVNAHSYSRTSPTRSFESSARETGQIFSYFFIATCEVYVLTLAVSFCTTLARCVHRENFSIKLKHNKLSNNYLIFKQNIEQNK